MILFVGTQVSGYFVQDVAIIFEKSVIYTGILSTLEEVANRSLGASYECIIFNVDELPGNHSEIADTISRIKQATNSHLVIMATQYNPQSQLIQALSKVGITNLLISPNISELKAQLESLFANGSIKPLKSVSKKETLPPTEAVIERKPFKETLLFKTVAVAGCISRMGATTQAIQLVKYLLFRGKKACYIEMNSSNYMDDLIKTYDDLQIDEQIGKVTYQNMDMFYLQDRIGEILRMGYDFYIYDYGVCTKEGFNYISYLEKWKKFIVCGTKPNEILSLNAALERYYETDIQYIFNFTSEAERPDVLELMSDKSQDTYFSGFTPDPFTYNSSNNPMYEKIFATELREPKTPIQNEKKKKHKLFGRRK